jgi:hypothetical protein
MKSKGKIKFVPSHRMKAHREIEAHLRSFLTLAVDGSECHIHDPASFPLDESPVPWNMKRKSLGPAGIRTSHRPARI